MNWYATFIVVLLAYVATIQDPYSLAVGGIVFIGVPLWKLAAKAEEWL